MYWVLALNCCIITCLIQLPGGGTYTHDWEIWVKNPNDGKIENFLEKAVFTLHETFKDHIRTVTKAPFKIKEQGYGSFTIKIDLWFKVSIYTVFFILSKVLNNEIHSLHFHPTSCMSIGSIIVHCLTG